MTTGEKKEGAFDPGCVTDIYDKLTEHNFALKAFGALLRSSDLSDFADRALSEELQPNKDQRASNLRCGLSQLIELYLVHQEQVLQDYCNEYHQSDIWYVDRSAGRISMVEQGAFVSRDVAVTRLREAITDLDIVINRRGDLEENAHELKGICLKYIEQLTGKKAPGV